MQILIIFLTFSFTLQIQKENCNIRNVHITLGDYFNDQKSKNIYRVGFMQYSQKCKQKIELMVMYNKKSQIFQISNTRKYSFKSKKQSLDYNRQFSFIDLNELENPQKFSYQFLIDGKKDDKIYQFESNVFQGQNLRFNFFGDHDIEVGSETIKLLENQKFDILILLGDYAYDMHSNNGKEGDDYLHKMQKLLTKQPVVLIPGNHDWVDDFQFFNIRFQYPGTKYQQENNMIFFQINDIAFISLNFDYLQNHPDQYQKNLEIFENYLKKASNFKYKIVLNHRGFFCVRNRNEMSDSECWVNLWQFKEIEDLMNQYNVDLFLASHDHQYIRFKPMQNYNVSQQKFMMILAGMGGTKHIFKKQNIPLNEFTLKEISKIKGSLQMDYNQKNLHFQFLSVDNEILDDFYYPLQSQINEIIQKTKNYSQLIFFGFLIFCLMYLLLIYVFKKRRNDLLENELGSIKPGMQQQHFDIRS